MGGELRCPPFAPGAWRDPALADLRRTACECSRRSNRNRLFMQSVYLLVMGLLLGYLAEQQKHLRAEKAVVTGTLSRIRVEAGLTGTIEQIFGEALTMYGASGVIVASQESHSQRVFVGELNKDSGPAPSEFRWLESASRDAKIYLDDFPGSVCYAALDGDRWTTLALDDTGHQVPVEQA